MRPLKATTLLMTLWVEIVLHLKPSHLLKVDTQVCKMIGFKELDHNLQNMKTYHMLLLFKYNLQRAVLAEGSQFAKLCA